MTSTFMERITVVLPLQGGDALPTEILAATAQDKAIFVPARPVNIVRWGYIVTTVLGNTTQVLAMDFVAADGFGDLSTNRVEGATDSDGVDTAGGTITSGEATAVGAGHYHDVSPKLKVDPGEAVIIEATAAPSSGDYYIFIEYEQEAFAGGSPAPALSFGNRTSNLTKKAS